MLIQYFLGVSLTDMLTPLLFHGDVQQISIVATPTFNLPQKRGIDSLSLSLSWIRNKYPFVG